MCAQVRSDLGNDFTVSENQLSKMTGNGMHLPSVGVSMLLHVLAIKEK